MSIVEMPTQAESGDGGEGAADDPGPSRSSGGAHRGDLPTIEIVDPASMLRASERAWLERNLADALHAVAREDGVRGGEIRVRLVDDAEIASAHEQRCGVAGVTDVITFDLADGAARDGGTLDADLLVCVDEARRQAAPRGWTAEREVLLYALHGVLHCVGYDDADGASSRRMHAREDEILDAIGVGRTFAARPGEGADGSDARR